MLYTGGVCTSNEPSPPSFDEGKDSAIRAIRAKLLNSMVIWRITRRSNGLAASAPVHSLSLVRARCAGRLIRLAGGGG